MPFRLPPLVLAIALLLSGVAASGCRSATNTKPAENVSSRRPRIFVRADAARVGRGLTLAELRARARQPVYRDWISYEGTATGWAQLPALAMQYLLTRDAEAAERVGEALDRTPFPYAEHTSTAAAVYHSAIAFDWVRDALSAEQAGRIAAKLVEGAEHLKQGVTAPSINHNYSLESLYGVATVALAIYGESERCTQKALEYLTAVDHMLQGDDMLLDAFRAKGGTWAEGNHYTPFVVVHPFLMTLRALTTATNTDYFHLIRERYGDFLEPMAKFLVANVRPDFTLERIGDVTQRVVLRDTFLRPSLELLASELDDAALQGQVRSFLQEASTYYGREFVPDLFGWMMLVSYDSRLPSEPSYRTLPLAMRFGEETYEHIMLRSGWGENSTLITYLSGDHFTDHQHFDKGHFLIYRNGGVIVDGGTYSSMYGESWSNYSTRTLAHNNVLVHDPDELPYESVRRTIVYPDGGQRLIRGHQSHRTWGHYLNARGTAGLDTAAVAAFDADARLNRYQYVKTDLTNAYGEKTTWIDRQLLYLALADYLVVKDRVITSEALDKYWLLHFQERPAVDGETPDGGVTDYASATLVRARRTGVLTLPGKTVVYSGGLLIKPLLPGERTVSIIGGPGYEYYNRFARKDFPPEKAAAPERESGHWRMEVSPSEPTARTVFLHAMQITDVDRKEMVPTRYLRSTDGRMEGALFSSPKVQYVALFSASLDERGDTFQRAELPIVYQLDAVARTTHVLVELQPGLEVGVSVNGSTLGTYRTTQGGVLSFDDLGLGTRSVRIEPE
ncbi:MAG: hypothetical protein GEU99_24170 [Luteitalea sp.]|nr:hypothetical protein [Luteitalea sp.]